MHHAISNNGAKEAEHYAAINRQEAIERAFDHQLKLILNQLQQGDPQTCSAFAEYCAERLDGEVTLALCLSRIHGDDNLQQQALAELRSHIDSSRADFCEFELGRRIARAEATGQDILEARYELDREVHGA